MAKGMFVDTSICTGCKACQVACKEWNGLDPEPDHFKSDPDTHLLATNFTGNSYDNTGKLSATDWRHVLFIEQFNEHRTGIALALHERFLQALHRCRMHERLPCGGH